VIVTVTDDILIVSNSQRAGIVLRGFFVLAEGVANAVEERECQEREAVREAQGERHVEGARGEDRELSRRLEPRRQEVGLVELLAQQLEAGRHDRAEEGCRPQGRQGDGAEVVASDSEGGGMARSISEVMTAGPQTIDTDATVVEAARVMRDADTGIVPVVDGEKVVATITDRDIAISVVAEGRDANSTKAIDVASRDLVTIDPQQDLDEALRLMARHQVRRLPVVEEDGRLVGIVAQADIATHASDSQTGEVVEEISK
jgi:CBS domain-containing protein